MLEIRSFLLSLLRANNVKWSGCGSEGNGALACGKSLDNRIIQDEDYQTFKNNLKLHIKYFKYFNHSIKS